ncbi:hypothetical protein LXL04_019460 [Taraxacum kok-saghyz]
MAKQLSVVLNVYVYVVYMGHNTRDDASASSLHLSMLEEVIGRDAANHMLQRYTKSFHGFSLTQGEAEALSVKRSTIESDIIIGVIDTGIWPESPSFTGQGYTPPPAKWNGICESNFPCNKRADGIYGPTELQSPRDSDGHGTHTASTAAGNIVRNADLLGLRSGIARGGVPRARIAVYKACFTTPAELFRDVFAIGSFHAMKNGIMTIQSSMNEGPKPHTVGSIAPWVLSVAAGTKNPDLITPVTLGNGVVVNGVSVNPFQLDRMYPLIYAGDGPNIMGGYDGSTSRFCSPNSLNKNLVEGKIILCDAISTGEPEMLAGAVGSIMTYPGLYFEILGSYTLPVSVVNSNQAKAIATYIKSTRNATTVIMKSEDVKNESAPFVASFSSRGNYLPITYGDTTGWIQRKREAEGRGKKKKQQKEESRDWFCLWGYQSQASFEFVERPTSGNDRGNNGGPGWCARAWLVATSAQRNPDLTAPGVRILAAWPPVAPFSQVKSDHRSVPFNIISGTSMACPHVAGIAAYIKTFNPTWSPTAIKSALMTTASAMSADINTDAEFAYGAGNVNPMKAMNPGLVYDAVELDYISFLCQGGYNSRDITIIIGVNSDCSQLIEQHLLTSRFIRFQGFPVDNRTSIVYAHSQYRRHSIIRHLTFNFASINFPVRNQVVDI